LDQLFLLTSFQEQQEQQLVLQQLVQKRLQQEQMRLEQQQELERQRVQELEQLLFHRKQTKKGPTRRLRVLRISLFKFLKIN
jgi:hypothetical protein